MPSRHVRLRTSQKIALARWMQRVVMAARRPLGLGPDTRVVRNGITWQLDLREGIDFSIWLLGAFEPETVRCYQAILRRGATVLDVGANIGAHTLPLARAVGPSGRVLAFEPTDYAFSKLRANCALNPALAARIVPLQMMLVGPGNGAQPVPQLYSSWPLEEEAGMHALHHGRLKTADGAVARTLDETLAGAGLQALDCIKLDIDGYECGMLRGAAATLSRWHPPIIMELAPDALRDQGASLSELVGLLSGHSYRLFDMAAGRPLSMNADELGRGIPRGASLNVLARAA